MNRDRMRSLSRAAALAVALAAVLALCSAPGLAREAPAGARAWLGEWHTNFGTLFFYSLEYSDVSWDDSGAEVSACQAYHQCARHWFLRGLWDWPGHSTVVVKGTPAGHDFDTLEPCWLGPASLDIPGATTGNACYAMLLYRVRNEERGGFWKECFLPEICTDHHHLHGTKTGPVYSAAFSFLQRGRPDGHAVISTQTGGAGRIIFSKPPEAGGAGMMAPGSTLFHVDDLGAAPEPQFTVALLGGRLDTASHGRTELRFRGAVIKSSDPRCPAGADVILSLRGGAAGDPVRIDLRGGAYSRCMVAESWTSTDPRRVSVHIAVSREG